MNIEKLKQAEADFLNLYPEGFADGGMQKIAKKHKMDKMVEFAQQNFSPDCTSHVEQTIVNMSRSSMVSMFEKRKFLDF